MSTPAPLQDHSVNDLVAHFPDETPRQTFAALVEAANDPARPDLESDEYRSPLWLIAIAMACLFGGMAALLALG